MRKLLLLSLLTLVSFAAPSEAAPILAANFCPGNPSCPAGLIEASLEFTDNTTTVDDLNDYFLLVTFTGNAFAPAYLDEFQFTIDKVKTPDGYEVKPSILAFSDDSAWQTFYDNISANADSCTGDTNSSQGVCTQSGPGNPLNFGAPLTNNTVTFQMSVDLLGNGLGNKDVSLLENTPVNLRAEFLDADGKHVTNLSPNSIRVPFPPDDPDGDDEEIAEVPEPATLLLLGSGLTLAVRRRRAKR